MLSTMLSTILPCLPCCNSADADDSHCNEKLAMPDGPSRVNKMRYHDDPSVSEYPKSGKVAAEDIIDTLRTVDSVDSKLRATLEDIVHEAGGWSESIARRILHTLQAALQSGKLGPAMTEACHQAFGEAARMAEFANEHPVLTGVFCTVVALGVIWLLWPTLLEALGFSELGPVEGSWAALWQSTYGGRVPVGSLFSYLQRLGITLKWHILAMRLVKTS